MRPLSSICLLVAAACGGNRGGGGDCAEAQHWADPDGRGGRCIENQSTCDDPSDCPQPLDECCAAACADSLGTGVYACVGRCDQPECTEGACGAGLLCQVIDECNAFCVPDDLACEAGTVPADPTDSGQFLCVREDSECFRSADCQDAALVDPCCTPACVDAGDARFECDTTCQGAGARDEAPGVACMCTTDADCIAQTGAGSRCVQGGGCLGGCWCEPDPSCQCEAAPRPACGIDGLTYDVACGESCAPVAIACEGECPCPDCGCPASGDAPVCGTDGQTYDASCGDRCVPVEIACRQECPCP